MKKILLVFCLLFATFFALFSFAACGGGANGGNQKEVIPQGGNENEIEFNW